MERQLVRLVWDRAGGKCEYCQLAQRDSILPFEIDHIVPCKHGGKTTSGNLCLSCFYCNRFKSSDLGGLERRTRRFVRLFNPRRQKWDRHFRWEGATLIGRTPTGRVTVEVLRINLRLRIAQRAVVTHGES
jgi:5-methylcytosine-specific restriction endonuclease McrA